jgi:hypothetical protein
VLDRGGGAGLVEEALDRGLIARQLAEEDLDRGAASEQRMDRGV